MADFDIISINSKGSFLSSMRKRKALGLLDSDSEDEMPKKTALTKVDSTISKSSDNPKPTSLCDVTNTPNTIEKKAIIGDTEKEIIKPVKNPYLKDEISLDFIKSLSASPIKEIKKPTVVEEKPTSVIDLLDDELYKEEGIPDANIDGLDPELAAILNKAPLRRVEPQKITVKLQYVQNFENLSDKARPILEKLLKPIKLLIMDNQQFQKVLDVFCVHKKLKKSEIVLIYNNDRLYLSGTPAGVGMCPNTINNIEVYTERSYKALLEERDAQKQERLRKWAQTKKDEDTFDLAEFETSSKNSEDELGSVNAENDDKMFLKLRGSDNKDILLRVKRTSTIISIIEKYKEITRVQSNLKLSFEGEDLDLYSTVGDVDLEDEDLVEVHLLG